MAIVSRSRGDEETLRMKEIALELVASRVPSIIRLCSQEPEMVFSEEKVVVEISVVDSFTQKVFLLD
jgi:hypothetical protein